MTSKLLISLNFSDSSSKISDFGDIPALILRKIILTQSSGKDSVSQEDEANKILESFRGISIRLDRLEHVLINQ